MSKLIELNDSFENRFNIFDTFEEVINNIKDKEEYIDQTKHLEDNINESVNIINEYAKEDVLEYKRFSNLDQQLENHKKKNSSNAKKREYIKELVKY